MRTSVTEAAPVRTGVTETAPAVRTSVTETLRRTSLTETTVTDPRNGKCSGVFRTDLRTRSSACLFHSDVPDDRQDMGIYIYINVCVCVCLSVCCIAYVISSG